MPSSASPSGTTYRAFLLLVLGLLAIVLFWRVRAADAPPARDFRAPPGEFSASRAFRDLKVIAAGPHVTGSPANRKIRDHLIRRLTGMGIEVEVQRLQSVRTYLPGVIFGANVENVVARIRGRHPGNAVLFDCHYDAVPYAPGAGDNGAACAAFLESIRALGTGAPPSNDLIFLFSDGEESGLLGAWAFAQRHAWMKDVRVVVDLEARGVSGPSTLFETGKSSGGLVAEYSRFAVWPRGNSLASALYGLIPNDTDFTIYRQLGYPGLNFAFSRGSARYHTPFDDLDHVDPRSLQHHGETVLTLARRLGGIELSKVEHSEQIYFNAGGIWVRYPLSAGWILWAIAALSWFVLARRALVRNRLAWMLGGVGFAAVFVLGAGVAGAAVLWRAVLLFHPQYEQMVLGGPYNEIFYWAASAAWVLSLCTLWVGFSRRRCSLDSVGLAVAGVLIAFTFVTLWAAPGASFLFQLTAMILLTQLAAFGHMRTHPKRAPLMLGVAAAAALALVLLSAGMVPDVYSGLTMRMSAYAGGLVGLLGLALLPLIAELVAAWRGLIPAFPLALVIASLINGSLSAGFDRAHARPDSLFYALDADTRTARWVSCDASLDEWTGAVLEGAARGPLPEFFPFVRNCVLVNRAFLNKRAPAVPLRGPVLVPLSRKIERIAGTTQVSREFRITSARGGDSLFAFFRIADPEAELLVDGQKVEGVDISRLKWAHRLLAGLLDRGDWTLLRYSALPRRGLRIEVRTRTTGPITVKLVDVSLGLPRGAGAPARPARTMPAPGVFPSDSTMVVRSYQLP